MKNNEENRLFRVTWGRYYKGDPILTTLHGTEDVYSRSSSEAMEKVRIPSGMDWVEAALKEDGK